MSSSVKTDRYTGCRRPESGKHLYLLSTGTGIAPFLSITKDPDVYEQFEKLSWFTAYATKDLAYYDRFAKELPEHEYLGDLVKEKLIYYPIVSREEYAHQGRLTDLMRAANSLKTSACLKSIRKTTALCCAAANMLKDTCSVLDESA